MKLVKQTKLVFVEGRSDKIYEVDLCEVGANQFVVNFRYGKRGAALKDGSKTVAPVKRDEAERTFDKLVRAKLDAGYVEEGGAPAAPPAPATRSAAPPPRAPGTVPISQDPRAQRILERLAAGDTPGAAPSGSTTRGAARPASRSSRAPGLANRPRFRDGVPRAVWPLERAIWRAGELALRQAEPLLIALIGTARSADVEYGGKGMRDYCIAWALGRCGSDAATRALAALYGSRQTPDHVKRIAAESLRLLGDPASNAEFQAHQIDQLPAALAQAARTGKPDVFAAALDEFPLHQHANTLHQLYLVDTATTRPAFLDALGKAPLRAPLFQPLRYIFKAAELRRDARVFGIFGYRFETTAANPRSSRNRQEAYSSATRLYLRRRIWRVLRRLGQAGDPDYVKLATGVLLPFTDADAVAPKQTVRRRGRTIDWDRFAPYLAFNHILYGKSRRYELHRNNKAWRMKPPHRPGGAVPPEREEAFPALWEQNPAALMQLCAQSECTPVHDFAGKALLACPAFLDELDLDDVILLLGRPYEATARVGFVIAQQRYDAARPNLPLLAALAACAHAPGRAQAFTWIDEQRALALGHSALLAALVIGRAPDTRAFGRRLLRSSTLTAEVGQALVGRLVAALLALPEAQNDLASDAVQTMTTALASHLGTVSVTVIRDLLAHPLPAVQELGAELLLRHDSRSGLIPADLILAVLHSAHENVRAAGMRLLGELPEAVLATMDLLLLRLCTDANADLRNASRPLVKRVADSYPDARDKIVLGLVEALLRRKLADDVPSHVLRVLVDDLAGGHGTVDKETLLRLLASGSPHAQELGGILLAKNLPPDALELDEIVPLASHEILSVRRAAWSMYEHGVARVQANMASAVRILDAKWRDSRAWAFDFFRGAAFGRAQFTADVLVGVIDSVREDVQAFGRELLQKYFDDRDGPALLHRLSEHPSRAVQLFATNYLERFAAGRPDRLEPLMPYFASVLSRVNQGRVAKQRVLAFLTAAGSRDAQAANIVIPLLYRLAATISIEYRASAIEAMMTIHRAHPEAPLPIHVKPVRVRPARAATPVAGGR
jgi:predicted DNA-binding WGR domain protein